MKDCMKWNKLWMEALVPSSESLLPDRLGWRSLRRCRTASCGHGQRPLGVTLFVILTQASVRLRPIPETGLLKSYRFVLVDKRKGENPERLIWSEWDPFPCWARRTRWNATFFSTFPPLRPGEITWNHSLACRGKMEKESVFFSGSHWPGHTAEKSRTSRPSSGAGDLVPRPEPCVPEGPERCVGAGRDHQVDNAATVEGEAEPALWRKYGARHSRLRKTAWQISELFRGLASAGWMRFGKTPPFGLCLHNTLSLWLPLRLGQGRILRLDGGAFPQQVCADFAGRWHVVADDVSGFYCVGHAGMLNFIKLQRRACKSDTS